MQFFLSIEFVLPEPTTLCVVLLAGGPQTSNPKHSSIERAGLVEMAYTAD